MSRACLFGENPITKLSEEFLLDPCSKGLVTVPRELIARVQGKFFSVYGVVDNLPDNGSTVYFLARSPAGVAMDIHSLDVGTSAGPINIFLYEAPTVAAVGIPIVPTSVNRLNNYVSVTEVWGAPTISYEGTLIARSQIGGEKHLGSGGAGLHDYLLKPETYYLFVIQNISSTVVDISYIFDWIEVSI